MYTHYFEITKRPDQVLWAQLMLDVQKLLNNLPTCEELEQLGLRMMTRLFCVDPWVIKSLFVIRKEYLSTGMQHEGHVP